MEKAFKNHLKSNLPYLFNSKVILAVSGGVDSMVLMHLCKTAKLDFSVAHCNFNLRNNESDGDEEFVVRAVQNLDIKVHVQNFNTKAFAEEHKLSIQMAARELRYQWFEELRASEGADYILVAHHANDSLETFLINLIRSTGPEGLAGIKEENEKILRPLLNFSRDEIESYAKEHKIMWREDSSNASTKYLRNKIRHQVIPLLEEMNPKFLEGFSNTQDYLKQQLNLVEDYTEIIYKKAVKKVEFGYSLDVLFLERLPNTKAVLYQLLKSFGFTEWDDVHHLLTAQSGKMVFSHTHRLVKDRDELILTKIDQSHLKKSYEIHQNEDNFMIPSGSLSFHEVSEIQEKNNHTIYVDYEKLKFPLTLRRWQEGDTFHPFGMKGRKKLSDFFKDNKLSLPQKENTWLLCSENKIVWIVNQRADNRFAITSKSKRILKIVSH
ncbi:tRNA lysidine(34) synthetase TilS [Zunongwangia endophytica]|uniref:tRNA(Ile)-lysidine synthase n=1 Tax=Zunongwangia endophytica TaxID=1808945 RepID=A0ABV8HA83_9FLAO|nr:tRNA lysidine(34) synthetase TilS [Zunongwangia endophytica]MDN3593559.1 tRNA lysidine(34) synthetase TilS [Zunongwangia endophytica]